MSLFFLLTTREKLYILSFQALLPIKIFFIDIYRKKIKCL